jgi:hypothetical protein
MIDCHRTGYQALGSQGGRPTLEWSFSIKRPMQRPSSTDTTSFMTRRGANAKMPSTEVRELIREDTAYP